MNGKRHDTILDVFDSYSRNDEEYYTSTHESSQKFRQQFVAELKEYFDEFEPEPVPPYGALDKLRYSIKIFLHVTKTKLRGHEPYLIWKRLKTKIHTLPKTVQNQENLDNLRDYILIRMRIKKLNKRRNKAERLLSDGNSPQKLANRDRPGDCYTLDIVKIDSELEELKHDESMLAAKLKKQNVKQKLTKPTSGWQTAADVFAISVGISITAAFSLTIGAITTAYAMMHGIIWGIALFLGAVGFFATIQTMLYDMVKTIHALMGFWPLLKESDGTWLSSNKIRLIFFLGLCTLFYSLASAIMGFNSILTVYQWATSQIFGAPWSILLDLIPKSGALFVSVAAYSVTIFLSVIALAARTINTFKKIIGLVKDNKLTGFKKTAKKVFSLKDAKTPNAQGKRYCKMALVSIAFIIGLFLALVSSGVTIFAWYGAAATFWTTLGLGSGMLGGLSLPGLIIGVGFTAITRLIFAGISIISALSNLALNNSDKIYDFFAKCCCCKQKTITKENETEQSDTVENSESALPPVTQETNNRGCCSCVKVLHIAYNIFTALFMACVLFSDLFKSNKFVTKSIPLLILQWAGMITNGFAAAVMTSFYFIREGNEYMRKIDAAQTTKPLAAQEKRERKIKDYELLERHGITKNVTTYLNLENGKQIETPTSAELETDTNYGTMGTDHSSDGSQVTYAPQSQPKMSCWGRLFHPAKRALDCSTCCSKHKDVEAMPLVVN